MIVGRIISKLARTKPVVVLVAAALLLGGSMGAASVVGINPLGAKGGEPQMSQEEAAQLRELFDEQQATWGFVSRHGRTGRIQAVQAEERTLEIDTPKGVLTARVGDDTTIHKSEGGESRTLGFDDLTLGALVTVDGATGTKAGEEAGEIEVLAEGAEGFDISPASGDGPRLVPLFP